MIKTNLKIENVIFEIWNWTNKKFWINKAHFQKIKNFKNQKFIKENWKIGIIKNLKKFIKVIPKIKKIRLYE